MTTRESFKFPRPRIGSPEYFGSMLTQVRKEEVNQNFAVFADKLGMSPLTYTNWESGRNGRVASGQIQNWGEKLGLTGEMWDEMYLGAGYSLPKEREEENQRQWDLAVNRAIYEGGEHPMAQAMDALLNNQPAWIRALNAVNSIMRGRR